MKPELALAAVVTLGLATVVVTVAVGSSVRESTVVSNPYEAGLHHAEAVAQRRAGPPAAEAGSRIAPPCDLGAGPCTRAAGPFEVTLELGPRPLRTMAELAALVEVRRDGAPGERAEVELSFEMRGMPMGENRRPLAAAGGGRYAGKAVLVRCPSGRKDWVATVAVYGSGREGPIASARFDFAVAE